MKQTNNAIKFLMAQYRAIFKNANIAMLAAIAASALAAGQAQAKPIDDWTAIQAGKVDVNNTTNLTISKSGTFVNEKAFELYLGSGAAATIKGDNTTTGKKGYGNFEAVNASITLDATSGGGAAATNATLAIGSSTANENAHVTVKSLTNKVGKLTIERNGADTTEPVKVNSSALTAKTITIGGDGASVKDGAEVEVKAHGSLNATGTAAGEGLIIGNNAKITVEASGKLDATKITMTSGTVSNAGTFNAGTLEVVRWYFKNKCKSQG